MIPKDTPTVQDLTFQSFIRPEKLAMQMFPRRKHGLLPNANVVAQWIWRLPPGSKPGIPNPKI